MQGSIERGIKMGRSAVIIKSNPYGLVLNLDPDLPFEELQKAVGEKFKESAAFFRLPTLFCYFFFCLF